MLKKLIIISAILFSTILSANEGLSIFTGISSNNHKIDRYSETKPYYTIGLKTINYDENLIVGAALELGYTYYEYIYNSKHEFDVSCEFNIGYKLNKVSEIYGILGVKTIDYVIETSYYDNSIRGIDYGWGLGSNIDINRNWSIGTEIKFYRLSLDNSSLTDNQKLIGIKIIYTF